VGRDALVVGIGGGAACDLAGFVAATYARGVALGLVPTTLVAQVDAAIGGKNGLDAGPWKNAVGTFHFPEFVLCDPGALASLPAAEIRAGLAEIAKAAAIGDRELFAAMEGAGAALLDPAGGALRAAMAAAIAVKVDIVSRDPFEAGERRLLNFGHTFGHAVEAATGYSQYLHGEAVAPGMVAATLAAIEMGGCAPEVLDRLEELLDALGLPKRYRGIDPGRVAEFFSRDKKALGGGVRLVVPVRLGEAKVTAEVAPRVLRAALAKASVPG